MRLKKILFLEAIAHTPHLETSAEIAIEKAKINSEVFFSWIGYDLPWHDWKIPIYNNILNLNLLNKIKVLEKILSDNNVRLGKKINLSESKNILINNWSKKCPNDYENLLDYKYKNVYLGSGVVSSLTSYLKQHKFSIIDNRSKIINLLKTSAIIFERTNLLINFYKPDEVYTFNSRFAISRAIILAAKKNKINVFRHERGSSLNKYEIYEKDLHDYKYRSKLIKKFWTKEKDLEKKIRTAKKFFYLKKIGKEISWISHTKTQIKNLYPKKIKKFRIVFFSSSNYEFASHLKRNIYWISQIQALNDILSICKKKRNTELIIRLHPHLSLNSNKKDKIVLTNFLKNKSNYIKPNDKVDSYALLRSADLVISYGSKISVEATYFKKPSISLRPSEYSGLNIVYEPKNKYELYNLINKKKLKPKPYLNSLKYGFYQLKFGKYYRIYKPINLFEGFFFSYNLSLKNSIISFIKKIFLTK